MKKSINKKLVAAVSSVYLATMLSGCFPKTDQAKESVIGSGDPVLQQGGQGNTDGQAVNGTLPDPASFPSGLTDGSVPNVDVRASFHMPAGITYQSTISTSEAAFRQWNQDDIISQIAGGRTVKSENTFENSGPEDLTRVCTFDDDSEIIFYLDSVEYTTVQEKDKDYASYFDYFCRYSSPESLDKEFGNSNIEGLNKDEAIQSAESILDIMQIRDMVGDPKILSMDHESINTLIELEKTVDKNGNPVSPCTSEDEVYALIYPVRYQGLDPQGFWGAGENEMFSSGKVYFIYGRTGLVAFHISGICDISSQGQLSYIFAPTKVVKSIQDEYSDIVSDEILSVNQIRLTYILRQEDGSSNVVMEPVWIVLGKRITTAKTEGEKYSYGTFVMLYSAVTGEKIELNFYGE